jgi:hypothetical protein
MILGLQVCSRARTSSKIVLRVVVVDPGGLSGLNMLLSRIGKANDSADGGGFSGSQKRIIVDMVALKHWVVNIKIGRENLLGKFYKSGDDVDPSGTGTREGIPYLKRLIFPIQIQLKDIIRGGQW